MYNINELEGRVKRYIEDNRLLDGVNKVYVAVSGGADSMVLLNYLNKEIGDITAVHVNHGIRGESARGDAKYVELYCKEKGIGYKLFDAEVDGVVVPSNASEEWARELRYGYFSSLIGEDGVVMATAHTLSDQAETILFRLARGTGLKGLCGIPVKRGKYIRPLMCLNRSEVEYMAKYYGIEYRTDETNLTDDYSRNKIRHNVIPVLKGINNNVEYNIGKLCERVEETLSYIDRVTDKEMEVIELVAGYKYDIGRIRGLDSVIQDNVIMRILSEVGVVSGNKIDELKMVIMSSDSGSSDSEEIVGVVNITDGIRVVVTNKVIVIDRDIDKEYKEDIRLGYIGLRGLGLEVEEISYEKFKEECKSKRDLAYYADKGLLVGSKVRYARSEDRFKPAKRVRKRVSKFISEIKVSVVDRSRVPVIEDKLGDIVYVYGIGFTDGYTPSGKDVVIRVRSGK